MNEDDHIRYMLDGGERGRVDELIETLDSFGFGGGLWIHRELPYFTDGVGTPHTKQELHHLRRGTEFYATRFALDTGATGCAIWFRRGSDPLRPRRDDDRSLCGWVPLDHEAELAAWIASLNQLIQTNLDRAGAPSAEDELKEAARRNAQGAAAMLRSWGLDVPDTTSMADVNGAIEQLGEIVDMRTGVRGKPTTKP